MKCTKAEQRLLLADSGELADRRERVLEQHVAGCEDCRHFQHALQEAKSHFPTVGAPSEKVVQNIQREARILAPAYQQTKVFYWKPAFALAATVFIGLGIFFAAVRPDTVGLELMMADTDLLESDDQIVSVMYSGLSEDDLAFNFLMTYEGNGQG